MLRPEPLPSPSYLNISYQDVAFGTFRFQPTQDFKIAIDTLRMTDAFTTEQFIYFALAFLVVSSVITPRYSPRIPTAGRRSVFEPTWLLRFRFITSARSIIQSGYDRYKHTSFLVRRLDQDLIVLSNKYLDELRLIPNTKLSNVHSQVKNMLGKYTYSTFLLESDQHVRVLQNYLIPNLKTFLSFSAEELDYSFQNDVPSPDDWEEIDIQKILQKMIARVSSRVFIGEPACRNETWLKLCLEFPINVFATAFIMRLFPPFLHPVIAWLVPTRYRLRQNIQLGKNILTPMITDYQSRTASGEVEAGKEKSNLMEWMIDNARGNEVHSENLAPRLMFLSLASIHSTSSAVAAALFDLCAHPEYVELLREEIIEVSGGSLDVCKEDLQRMWKLDSFLKESQRCNPPTLLSPQRIAMQNVTLSDGTFIPAQTQIAFPSASLFSDPTLIPNPDSFDGFRYYRKRLEPGQSTRHLMVSTDKDHLYFGHGKQACPGRFFAANEIKMIIVRILMEYEIRLLEGKSKPKAWTVDEMVFADPRAKLEIKKRPSTARI